MRRRIVLAILALCLLAVAGLGVYCWKVLVWNPENLTTETQEASYKSWWITRMNTARG